MSTTLESPFFQLTLDPAASCWSVSPADGRLPPISAIRMILRYRAGMSQRTTGAWLSPEISGPQVVSSPHGPLRQITLRTAADPSGLRLAIVFALPENYPLVLWKVTVENSSSKPVLLDTIEMLQVEGCRFSNQPSTATCQPSFFSNGWQSWSHSNVYGLSDRAYRNRLGPFQAPMCVNPGTPQPKDAGHFTSDMFGVLADRVTRAGWLAGFLSQKQHFGSLEARLDPQGSSLRLWANGDGARLDPSVGSGQAPGASVATDWACLHTLEADSPDPLGPYLDAVAREHLLHAPRPTPDAVPTGWCSWYHFFQKVTAEDVRRNLATAAAARDSLPLGMIQLDDGFEYQIGDWFKFNGKFPGGVSPLAAEIRQEGFTPGLWLAPFIVHPKSMLANTHPDWLLRGRAGRPVNAGYVWDAFNYALDLTHPEARQYACDVIHTASHEWGYDFLKLDFLYAASLPGRYRNPTMTRAQALRLGLDALRQAAGDGVHLLGCGCPLGSGVGIFDSMRISCDVSPRWTPVWNGIEFFFRDEPDMPSARNAIHNTLTRLPLHRRWWVNDPDCLLLRPESDLTLPEVQTLATAIALSGGTLLLSDDLSKLPEERLRIARQLLPLIGKAARALDWLDADPPNHLRLDLENVTGRWHLLAAFNWDDAPRELPLTPEMFGLPKGEYFAREFWPSSAHLPPSRKWEMGEVPAHGVRLLAVRAVTPGAAQYLGSDLHISQGLEVVEWQTGVLEAPGVSLRVERPGRAEGSIYLALPHPPQSVTLNGQQAAWEAAGEGCYRLGMIFEGIAQIQIR